MAYKLIGKDFIPHDVVAKVTGQARYAEDFRAEGMVFCRLLTSPMPHARIRNIDVSAALKMEGVFGVLTPDDVPPIPAPGAPSNAVTRPACASKETSSTAGGSSLRGLLVSPVAWITRCKIARHNGFFGHIAAGR